MHVMPSAAVLFNSSTSRSTPWITGPDTGGEHGIGQLPGGLL